MHPRTRDQPVELALKTSSYTGRFAPSPTGLLHAGSLVAALASWLDARARQGRWLVRIEDVDAPRCIPGAGQAILRQLAACQLLPDEEPAWQSRRGALYARALAQLERAGLAYPCSCTRKDIASWHAARGHAPVRGQALPYPGLCRPERGAPRAQSPRAWRLHTLRCERKAPAEPSARAFMVNGVLHWHDRRLGAQQQSVSDAVGDFILRRADGLWAYQLAVVVDDAAQGVTHVVRGADLADNTPRQILLQSALGAPTPLYLHTPLVLAANGEKLSKQNHAAPLDLSNPMRALNAAAQALGLPAHNTDDADSIPGALAAWVRAWRQMDWAAT